MPSAPASDLTQSLNAVAAGDRQAAAIALLRRWREEDAALSPEGPDEAEDFFRSLDAARASNRPLFPPELKGTSW